jgi:hypothetical protein
MPTLQYGMALRVTTTCASEEKSNKFVLLEKKKDHIIFKIKPNYAECYDT